jgi:predicted phosphodiesterase
MKRLLYFLAALLFALPMTAAAQPSVHVVSGPYLQAVGEREFTVVWTTNIDAVSWVEIAPDDGTHFYNTERPKYYQVLNGRRPIGKLHVVTVSGLEPATTYRYRVMQNGVLVNEGRKRVIFGEGFGSDILRHKPFEVTTLDRSKSEVAFSVVNDMHEHDSILRVLYKDVKPGKYDFVCFNGDMLTSMESEKQLFEGYLNSAAELLTPAGIPIFATRGNHENRGAYAQHWLDYFPTPTGETYYTFRRGPAFFIVLDGCEDKPDNDPRYYGMGDWNEYRRQQTEWLKGVVNSDEFRAAPVRIVLMHMIPGKEDSWYGEQQIRRLFVPELAGKGIDLMLCGHYHRYHWIDDGSRGVDFPILVNSNNDCLRVSADAKGIDLKVVNTAGAVIKQHRIDKK